MDEKLLKNLKNFEAVWRRVSNDKQGRRAAEKAGVKLKPGKCPRNCNRRFAPFN